MKRRPPRSPLFPSTTLFRSDLDAVRLPHRVDVPAEPAAEALHDDALRRLPHLRDEPALAGVVADVGERGRLGRSEEHTSELQSRPHLVCRLLLEKKKSLSYL